MTELYLIRHARAVEYCANDSERPLMPEGRHEARAVGAALRRESVVFDAIACSSLVRAVETATLMAVEVGYEGGLTIDPALLPDGSVRSMIRLCSTLPGDRVALVGHEPSMGLLLSDLVGRPGMSMVKAGVVRLALPSNLEGGGKIVWSITPRQLTPRRGA